MITTLARRPTYSPIPIRRPTRRPAVKTPTPRRDDVIANAMASIAQADVHSKAEAALLALTVAIGLDCLTWLTKPELRPHFLKIKDDPAALRIITLTVLEEASKRALTLMPGLISTLNHHLPGWTPADVEGMRLKDGQFHITPATKDMPATKTPTPVQVNFPPGAVTVNIAPPQLNIAEGAIQAHTHLDQSRTDLEIEYQGDKPTRIRRSR